MAAASRPFRPVQPHSRSKHELLPDLAFVVCATCANLAPDGSRCNSAVYVGAKRGNISQLEVRFLGPCCHKKGSVAGSLGGLLARVVLYRGAPEAGSTAGSGVHMELSQQHMAAAGVGSLQFMNHWVITGAVKQYWYCSHQLPNRTSWPVMLCKLDTLAPRARVACRVQELKSSFTKGTASCGSSGADTLVTRAARPTAGRRPGR